MSLRSDTLKRFLQNAEISLEEQQDEIEYELYVKLTDLDQLNKAHTVVNQEQWEYRIKSDNGEPKGTLRVRKIDDGDSYELTVKAYTETYGKKLETTNNITFDMYEAISLICDRMLRKTRYSFPVTLKEATDTEEAVTSAWEVDLFILPDGSIYPWAKIDFEIPNFNFEMPSLPFQVEEMINFSFNAKPSDEDRAIVDSIFNEVKTVR